MASLSEYHDWVSSELDLTRARIDEILEENSLLKQEISSIRHGVVLFDQTKYQHDGYIKTEGEYNKNER